MAVRSDNAAYAVVTPNVDGIVPRGEGAACTEVRGERCEGEVG